MRDAVRGGCPREAWPGRRLRRFLSLDIRWQTEGINNPFKVIAAVEFDLDPAAFLTVMNRDPRGEMLLEASLQVAQSSAADRLGPFPAPRAAMFAQQSRNHPFGGANG